MRYARPHHHHIIHHPRSHTPPPRRVTYRHYYTRWWCHPYYRYQYATVAVVSFGFSVHAWHDHWVPPRRAGWTWVPGYWSYGYWHPGHWSPVAITPAGYIYVGGHWDREVYVEGYYRTQARSDWDWVEGYYLEDGTYVSGHWLPNGDAPEGYVWEPGFFDGENYVDGFWRPEFRPDFTWVSAHFDEDGVYNAGYWLPLFDELGMLWVPGWFDGQTWNDGYWEQEEVVLKTDLDDWQPEEGWDAGWEVGDGWGDGKVDQNDTPLAIPVD